MEVSTLSPNICPWDQPVSARRRRWPDHRRLPATSVFKGACCMRRNDDLIPLDVWMRVDDRSMRVSDLPPFAWVASTICRCSPCCRSGLAGMIDTSYRERPRTMKRKVWHEGLRKEQNQSCRRVGVSSRRRSRGNASCDGIVAPGSDDVLGSHPAAGSSPSGLTTDGSTTTWREEDSLGKQRSFNIAAPYPQTLGFCGRMEWEKPCGSKLAREVYRERGQQEQKTDREFHKDRR
jgi:hypothetical protein